MGEITIMWSHQLELCSVELGCDNTNSKKFRHFVKKLTIVEGKNDYYGFHSIDMS